MRTFLVLLRSDPFFTHNSFIRRVASFTSFAFNYLRHYITMKIILVTISVLLLVTWTSATFGPWTTTPKPLAVVLQPTENVTNVDTIDLDRPLSDDASNETTTTTEPDMIVEEESSEKTSSTKPGRCIKSTLDDLIKSVRHNLRVLYHWTISALSIPIVFIRNSIINLYTTLGDALFNTMGYVDPECRYKVICEMSSVMSNYIPRTFQNILENNMNALIGAASRAKILNADSEYIQAAFVGSMERNCTIYDDAKC